MKKKYGYAMISSMSEKTDQQLKALVAAGIVEKNIFVDRQSGKTCDRPYYQKLVKAMQPGDCLYIKSIVKLGKNYEEIKERWKFLVKEKQVDIVVLDFPLLDTRKQKNETAGSSITDLVLEILSYVVQSERKKAKKRQAEGIKMAKEKGQHFGRPKLNPPKNFHKVYQLWKVGEITKSEAARRLNTNSHTFSRWTREEYPS